MSNWKNLDQYKKLYRFIGKQSAKLLCFGVITGIGLSIVDVTFAYILQAFLVVMKVVPSSTNMNFPRWLPSESPYSFLAFITLVLLAKGIIQWTHSFLSNAAYEVQRDHQRVRLIEWAFNSKSANTGEIFTLYNQGIESVCSSLVALQNIAIMFSTSILIFFYLLKISFLITSISFTILALIALVTRGLDVKVAELGKKANSELEQIHRSLISNLKNLLLLQIYGTQDKEKTKIKTRLRNVLHHVMDYQHILNLKGALPQTLGIVLICSLCVVSTTKSWVPAGLMITYFYLFLKFVQHFSEVVRLVSGITFSLAPTLKFAKWWADHSHDGIRNAQSANPKKSAIQIDDPIGWEFQNVNFNYPNTTLPILFQFSLTVRPRTCVVLVGESGSGKSTILALALGLLDPVSGRANVITEEGGSHPIQEIQSSLLKNIGYVGPESFLIEGTIYENLVYGLPDTPTAADVEESLKVADCQFINAFPNRLEHYITEQGQGLSAGQKQRLSFARAILRKPKVLILDEATSNLDKETEEKFVQTLAKLKNSVTILAVTHREALLSIADQVVKLQKV